MKNLSRVVWSEGMYLGPHHFQVQSRYFEDSIRFVAASLWFESYGLVGAEFDPEALRNGTLSMVHGRGLLPDGLPFNMPDCDALPEPRQIAEIYPPTREKVRVLLGIPPRRASGVNCVPVAEAPLAPNARFHAISQVLPDETTGRDEKAIYIGRKNLRLFLDTENTSDFVTMPVARIMRDSKGSYIYDPEFIPPAVDICASERLLILTQRLVEILEEKSAALSAGKKAAGKSWSEYSTSEVARFWMLHAVHASLPSIHHLLRSRRGHPEELYREMARLAGALCTFAIDSHPRTLPLYDHLNLDVCFNAIDDHIRRHLEALVPTKCLNIPLRQVKNYFWHTDPIDQRTLDHARWVLAIYSDVGEAEIILRTPAVAKICSAKHIENLVNAAMPGLQLTHLRIPPSAISVHADTQYFGISRAGPCWSSIVETRHVGIYVPGDLPNPKIELLVVLES